MSIKLCALAFLSILAMSSGCDYDDPEDPGDPGDAVDFIRFTENGHFRERFLDLVFQSGELAVDELGGGLAYVPRLGPSQLAMELGIDDDFAPYPNLASSRKYTMHNGARDLRYWTQFAGGAWSSLYIEVVPLARYRASSSPPSFFPMTMYQWCPATRPCMSWLTAVGRREVRCFKYGLNGNERPVGGATCVNYHPRMHWRVVGCDDCPLPAGEDGAAFYREDE